VSGANTVALRPHAPLSASLRASLESILLNEHPIPHLQMHPSRRVAPPWRIPSASAKGVSAEPIDAHQARGTSHATPALANEWLRGLLAAWIHPDAGPGGSLLWTDLYVHPTRMTEGKPLQSYISALGVVRIDFVPESDPNCVELCGVRCRLFW